MHTSCSQHGRACTSHHHTPVTRRWVASPARPWRAASTKAAEAEAGTQQQQQQPPAGLLPAPPPGYDYKADILPETREVVGQHYPQLMDLVDAGHLVAYRRPAGYVERRDDGYQEPALILLLGSAHVSAAAAGEAARLIAAVQPDAVVLELCRSRMGVLHSAAAAGQGQQQQQPGEQQRRLRQQQQADLQQRWRQQYEQQRQRHARREEGQQQQHLQQAATAEMAAVAAAPASSSSAASSWEEEPQAAAAAAAAAPSHQGVAAGSSPEAQSSSSTTASSSSGGWWSGLAARLAAGRAAKAANPLALAGSGGNPLADLARSASLGGSQAMLLRLLMAGQAARAADQLGVQPGAEFRAAAEAAAALPDGHSCALVLGDRPIEITLSRAWAALPWGRRLQLLADLLGVARAVGEPGSQASQQLSQAQVEALRSDDAVSALFAALSGRYPELVAPLVHERDLYLSWSLKRSKAVNGARAVVGMVGKGHLRGVVYALKHDAGALRFRDLVGGKNSGAARRAEAAAAARRLALELLLGGAAYAAWVAGTTGGGGGGGAP